MDLNSCRLDGGDWRSQLLPDSRQRIVNKIMDTLKRHLPFSGAEGLQELRKIAVRFEEKIYSAATSQSDYLRKISLKMLTMESKAQNTLSPALSSNSAGAGVSRNLQDSVHNQGRSVPVQMVPNESQLSMELMMTVEKIEEKMCDSVMSQQDYKQKLDNLEDAIIQAIASERAA